MGDPIEFAALTRAFRRSSRKKQFCALGSVKSNFGHLDAAAGVIGLIKTALSLSNQKLLPSLNFERINPEIDIENSPFFVQTKLSEWDSNGAPRRAAVSAFGVGGTNAHAILEEAPLQSRASEARPFQLLTLSAKTETALDTVALKLAKHLGEHRELNLADVAHTLQVGRRELGYRRSVVCRDVEDAISASRRPTGAARWSRCQRTDGQGWRSCFPGRAPSTRA